MFSYRIGVLYLFPNTVRDTLEEIIGTNTISNLKELGVKGPDTVKIKRCQLVTFLLSSFLTANPDQKGIKIR